MAGEEKKAAVCEHPATTMACTALPQTSRIQRVRADLCEYGMAVQGVANKKPVGFHGQWCSDDDDGAWKALWRTCASAVDWRHSPTCREISQKVICQAMIEGASRDVFGDYFNQIILRWASDNEAAVEESKLVNECRKKPML